MSATELRNELLQAKRDLIAIMREVIGPINIIACKIEAEADKLLKASLEENPREIRTRKIVYKDGEPVAAVVPVKEGRRACSICRQPGHRSTTCPQRKES